MKRIPTISLFRFAIIISILFFVIEFIYLKIINFHYLFPALIVIVIPISFFIAGLPGLLFIYRREIHIREHRFRKGTVAIRMGVFWLIVFWGLPICLLIPVLFVHQV